MVLGLDVYCRKAMLDSLHRSQQSRVQEFASQHAARLLAPRVDLPSPPRRQCIVRELDTLGRVAELEVHFPLS